jgi:hypothetical protein
VPNVAVAQLPRISDVDRVNAKLGSVMSDLDVLASNVAAFFTDDVSHDDAVFMERAGIAVDEKQRHADPATIARLLVFADETLNDLETIRDYALRLRRDLLVAYREFVLEPSGRRRCASRALVSRGARIGAARRWRAMANREEVLGAPHLDVSLRRERDTRRGASLAASHGHAHAHARERLAIPVDPPYPVSRDRLPAR